MSRTRIQLLIVVAATLLLITSLGAEYLFDWDEIFFRREWPQ